MTWLVFEFEDYYPAGGWNDWVGTFATEAEALEYLRRDVQHGQYRPASNAQLVQVAGWVIVRDYRREVEFVGSPPRGPLGEARWGAPSAEWTYPEDPSGRRIRWHVSEWEELR